MDGHRNRGACGPASCCGGDGDEQSCAANADNSGERRPDVASGDDAQECAWHGADDQDGGACGERHVDGGRCGDGDDDDPDASSNLQLPQRQRHRPAD